MTPKNTICLWYDGTALEAAQFYAKTFPDSSVGAVHRAPGDFPNGKEGEIRIRLNQTQGEDLNLTISDNGVGFPPHLDWEQTDSLGLHLVRSLTDQLNGTIKCRLDQGTRFEIRFRPVASDRQK